MKRIWKITAVLSVLTLFSLLIDKQLQNAMVSIQSQTLDKIMLMFSALGGINVGLPFLLMIIIMLEITRKEKITLNLFASVLLNMIIVFFIKLFFDRSRPIEWKEIGNLDVIMSSFPSAHTSTAFAMFGLLNKYYKKPYILYGIAFLIGLSRIYFGVHYLSDVLAGAMIGLLIANFVYENNLGKDVADRIIKLFKNKSNKRHKELRK